MKSPIKRGAQPLLAAILLGLAAACVQVEPKSDFDRTGQLIRESTGREEVFDPYASALSDEDIREILDDGLTLDEALRIALLNNRELRADFQDIGIAHADWVQAQLLSNPSLDVLIRFPNGGGRSLVEASLGVQLLELWRIPVRTELAQKELESAVLRIARRAGERLAETRSAYWSAVAADELVRVSEENVALASRSFEAVQALHAAGSADAFDENRVRGPLLRARLDHGTAKLDAANAKRELAKKLSLYHAARELALTDSLPDSVPGEYQPDDLVARAMVARLDLRAISATIEAMSARMTHEERKAWGEFSAGPAVERPAGSGNSSIGPTASLSLPIFDQNQAQVARAGFELEQVIQLEHSARIAVAQDVRSSLDRFRVASENLDLYRDLYFPQAERSLEYAHAGYSQGRTTLAVLIEQQRQLLEARKSRILLQLDAIQSKSDLERELGKALDPEK